MSFLAKIKVSGERSEVIEELCTLLESTYDVLGSMLHDLTLTNLLIDPNQEGHDEKEYSANRVPSPPLGLVLEALCRVASFPLPRRDRQQIDPLSLAVIDRLYHCHAEVIALTERLVNLSLLQFNDEREGLTLQATLSVEKRLSLLKLWCLLESQLDGESVDENRDDRVGHSQRLSPALRSTYELFHQQSLRDHLSKKESVLSLLNATLAHQGGLDLVEALISEHEELCLSIDLLRELRAVQILPTPLARLVLALRRSVDDFEEASRVWHACQQARQDARGTTGVQREVNSLNNDLGSVQEDQSTFLKTIQSHLVSLIQKR